MIESRAAAYHTIRRLAVGGMGEVFLARQRGPGGFDRLVVVKRLLPQLVESTDVANMFFDEARIVANLVHPNIVQIYELGLEDGRPFLALEYVAGENLARICERADRAGVAIRRELAAHVIAETARALEFAHRAIDADGNPLGIVHRDVSPQNVMVSRTGDVKLTDFGIAKAVTRLQRTETGAIKGKVAYMAPEQIRGEAVDPRADVFAAGVVLWELTVGARLFAGQNDAHTITKVIAGVIPRPRTIDPSYPEDLEAIVMAALAPVEQRTSTAGDLELALRNWLARSGTPIDKAELGRLVVALFPNTSTDHEPLASTRDGADPSGTRTAALAMVVPAAHREAAGLVAPRRRRWTLLAIGIALGIGLIARCVMSIDEPPQTVPVIAADAAWPRAAEDAADRVDRVDAALAIVPPIDAGSLDAPPRDARRAVVIDAPRPRPIPADGSAIATITAPPDAEPEAPRKGRLIVNSPVWGSVTIDRHDYGSTPVDEPVAPGSHDVVLVIHGKQLSALARVEPGQRTKCLVEGEALKCGAPQL